MAKPKKVKAGTSKSAALDKKIRFAEAYLSNGGNATQAALEAGYSAGGASKTGYRLSKDAYVLSIIRQRQAELVKKYELTTEAVIRSIAQDLHFDPAKLFDAEGNLLSIQNMDEDTRKTLQSMEVVQVGSADAPIIVRKVKFADKARAREQAMRHLGMFERDNAQSQPVTKIVMIPPKRGRDE